ncbi:hypothetical protein [Tenacibaculum amylolyticum]|uniref:hypothetical protein n=1 Tax=Tenacibaculum amylolyticum TaxID=104269 RepID=UPI0038B628A5
MSTILPKTDTWSVFEKISFRFFFTYFILFIFLNNNGAFPFYGYVNHIFNLGLYEIIPWIGEHILGITYEIRVGPNGSGDTTYDYLLIFTLFVIAIITAIIWSVIDRKAKSYVKMYYWLTLIVRFYVGLMLINYGLVKVIQVQFSAPTMYRLTQAYGDSSPMGLAWTFLGFSKGYNLFMGIAEVAAVLLLFRRTLTFGLIITLMTTANVMAVNYFYDVPVKILSTHLVIMTAFLLAHSFKTLWQFFFFRKPIALTDIYKPALKSIVSKVFLVIKALVLVYVLGFGFYETLSSRDMYYGEASKSPLKGFYEVEEFKLNDSIISCPSKEKKLWKYLMIDGKQYAQIKPADSKTQWYKLDVDSVKKSLVLKSYRDTLEVYNLTYMEGDSTDFYLKGTVKLDTLAIKLQRTKNYKEKFLLTNRGFHWINERPYNR